MEQIKFQFRGVTVTYSERLGRWQGKSDANNIDLTDPQLEGLKVKIEKRLVAVKRQKREPAFAWKEGGGRWSRDGQALTKVKVTSKDRGTRYSGSDEYWISVPSDQPNKRPERMKIGKVYLYAEGGENDKIVAQINTAYRSIAALEKEISDMKDQLAPFEDPWGDDHDQE